MRKNLFGIFSFFLVLCLMLPLSTHAQLKSMVFDFDGLDVGQTDLPDGDYAYGDLTYQVNANPLAASDMLGDRVAKLNLNWNSNYGSFGRGVSRYIEFDAGNDVFNFYFYNPSSNGQNADIEVLLGDDDDQSGAFEYSNDDIWRKSLSIPGSSGWQLVSIPLNTFSDNNPGGNGLFDIAFTGNKGKLMQVEFKFNRHTSTSQNATFYIDMICFSEGILPRGNTEFDLPYKSPSDHARLGAFQTETMGQNNMIPVHFEGLFPPGPGKKLKYVNYFMGWSQSGTVPNSYPANDVQTLLNNGYTPIITWEPMFGGYDRLDPVQPRLSNIINGDYNAYIDAYADKVKLFSDTIIIRLMHEFDGDWYPWSVSQNDGDPAKYVAAYQKIVNRFKAKGVTNVQWMWCINSDYAPYASYNWIVFAYPGDNYVDIVATDIYNNHLPLPVPWWKSFRCQTTESYYYLNKYFPQKPLYICEVGCRERYPSENISSESKGDWYVRMDKEIQSNFRKARALIFFNANPDQNWFVNSSQSALQSLTANVWQDDYYFKVPLQTVEEENENEYGKGLYIYPNPTNGAITISYSSNSEKKDYSLVILNVEGKKVYEEKLENVSYSLIKELDLRSFPRGIYYVEMKASLNNGQKGEEIKEVAKLILR